VLLVQLVVKPTSDR